MRRDVRLALMLALAAALAGCGSAPKRGGYYQDDGPGGSPPPNLDRIADAKPKVEPLNRGANNPYTVFGRQYVPYKTLQPYRQRGIGSWYGRKFHGQRTSSGERYDMYAMTAAHPTLPIPSYARVTDLGNGRSVIVRINDRGPFRSGRIIDLSYAAAYRLGYAGSGSATVEVEAILPKEMPLIAAQGSGPAVKASPSAPLPAAVPEAKPIDVAIPIAAEANGIFLQLGAFSARENAENFRVKIYQQLAWLNQPIRIERKGGLFRLHLGPYRNRAEATGVADRIRDSLELKPVVVVR
ncbi:MAG: septal ring lytic transglycosylase RlpA family protein [Burkholderiales bacterium]